MFWDLWKYNKRGILVLEVLIGLAIVAIAFSALLQLATFSIRLSGSDERTVAAEHFARETAEAIRSFRDDTDWATTGVGSLQVDVVYHPYNTGSPLVWRMALGEEVIGSFTRSVVFLEGRRDAADNLIETGGAIDPNTRRAFITVSWSEHGITKQITLTTIFTSWNSA